MAKDSELREGLDLTSPQTVPDVVFQTHAIVQQIVVRLDGIDRRLDAMDRRMDRMDSRMDRMESRMDKIEERINGNFVWTTGIRVCKKVRGSLGGDFV